MALFVTQHTNKIIQRKSKYGNKLERKMKVRKTFYCNFKLIVFVTSGYINDTKAHKILA